MKNILVISTSLSTRGGISSVLKLLFSSELNKKYKLYHLSSHRDGNAVIKSWYIIQSYFLYPFILFTQRIDLVDIHGSMRMSFLRKGYFLIIGKLFKKKVVYHMHSPCIDNHLEKISTLKRRTIIKLFDLYDLIFTLCDTLAHDLQKWTVTPVRFSYNPVLLPSISTPRISPKQIITVLTLGELGERKGTEDLLKVAQILVGNNIQFRIGGNGDIGKYRDIAKDFGIH